MAKKKATTRSKKSDNAAAVDFEAALEEVEQIVAMLESGDLGLTDSLDRYEQGIMRLKQCHALLDAAEHKVCLLSGFDADGNPITEELEEMEVRSGSGRGKASRTQGESPDPSSTQGNGSPGEGSPHALSDPDVSEDSVDDSPGLF